METEKAKGATGVLYEYCNELVELILSGNIK